MYSIYEYLSEAEAGAERAYRQAYHAEYMRVYEPGHGEDRERLVYWSELAHQAGKAARERVLAAHQPAYPPTV